MKVYSGWLSVMKTSTVTNDCHNHKLTDQLFSRVAIKIYIVTAFFIFSASAL